MRMTRMGRKHEREPSHLRCTMNGWRRGWVALPQGYITYHTLCAKAELGRMQEKYGFEILRKRLVDDGWFDGMRVTEVVIETRSQKLLYLKYHDANGEFMIRRDSGGHAAIQDSELA